MESENSSFIDKLRGLLSLLTHTHEEFEMVADEVEDCNLRTALNSISMESSLYVTELSMLVKSLGINVSRFYYEKPEGANDMPIDDLQLGKGNELSFICNKNENFILSAYRNILNENFLLPGLRDIMLYQLDALKCGFMKIKLLNSARFSGFENQALSM